MGSSEASLLLPHTRGKSEEEEEARAHDHGAKRWWWRRAAAASEGRWGEATAEAGRLAALAGPMIAVALLQLTMQLISTVMVGHLGEVPLAGAAIANSLTNVSGFSVLVSLIECPPSFFFCFSFFFQKQKLRRAARSAGSPGTGLDWGVAQTCSISLRHLLCKLK